MPTSSRRERKGRFLVDFVVNAGVTVLYFALAKFSFYLSFQESTSTPIWPASGIALALAIIMRRRVWPGIFIGALCSNIYNFFGYYNGVTLHMFLASLLIAIGNLIEAELPAYLLSRNNKEIRLPTTYKYLFSFVMAILVGNIVSATIGNVGLMSFGIMTLDQFPVSFISWMLGGFSSMIGLTPFIISWYKDWNNLEGHIWGRRFLLLFFLSLVLVTFMFYYEIPYFGTNIHVIFISPVILFALISLPRSLFYLFLSFFTIFSTIATISGFGPFANGMYQDALFAQQYFVIILFLASYWLDIEINKRFPRVLKFRKVQDKRLEHKYSLTRKNYNQAIWMSMIIGVFGLMTTVFLWNKFRIDHEQRVDRKSQLVMDRIKQNVAHEVMLHFDALKRMASRFDRIGDPYYAYWRDDAKEIKKDFEGFRAIEWIDTNLVIREVEPEKNNEAAINLNLYEIDTRWEPLLKSQRDSSLNITYNFPLIQGGKSFIVDMPYYFDGKPQGFVTGLLCFDSVFAKVCNEFDGSYMIVLEDEHEPFFIFGDSLKTSFDHEVNASLTSALLTPWKLSVIPTQEEVNAGKSVFATLVLGLGLFVTIFVSLIVYLSRIASINANLADESLIELKELNEELSAQKQMAENASKAKSDFLSMMSHEMRTPLNAIIGMSHLLLSENLKEEHAENLRIMEFSSQNLLALINDILDFNKIEVGKVELEEVEFDLVDLIRTVKDSLQLKDKDLPILIEQNKLINNYVVTDPFRLSQVFLNLMGNAVKFTKEGFVKIKVELYSEDENFYCIRFAIIDTGIGIPEEKYDEIFEMFSQTEKAIARNYGGSGLGLAIAKGILNIMDSEVRVESEVGKGSTFFFDLVLRKGAQIGENYSSIRKEDYVSYDNIIGKKILIVEDNAVNAFVVQRFLEKKEAILEVAENGKVAVEKVIGGQYDLILMDLQMPEMNGFEATEAIRSLSIRHRAEVPIIALTANVIGDVIEHIFESGMDDYLSKPFTPDELYYIVSKWCSGKEKDFSV